MFVAARQSDIGFDRRADRRAPGTAFIFEGAAVVIALDVHLEDRGVMHQTVDDGDGHRRVREDLAQPPNGWLAVMSSKRRL